MKHRSLAILLCACLLLTLAVPLVVQAAEEPATTAPTQPEAQLLSTKRSIRKAEGFPNNDYYYIYDDNLTGFRSSESTASITLENDQGIGYLYFIYQSPYLQGYTVTDNTTGKTITAGLEGFLHEVVDLKALLGTAPTSVTIRYDQGKVQICELMLYTEGKLPDTVQQWQPPAEGKTDLLLFSTHGDDEQLFFAGILPYYAKALGYNVQVVYLVDHHDTGKMRVHEMLNGLWAVGCQTYPVFGDCPDFLEETIDATYAQFKKQGITREDILEFCTQQIRRFKPKVVVAHDFAGEYKHGQHMVYADCVAEALVAASDATLLPEQVEIYGTWDTPKAYFHLYAENPIVMDWDTPMPELDGMTPFEVTQKLGFPCHKSQQWTWFTGWINGKNGVTITRADQISTHSPCKFGLYRSTVGADVAKNDFFENVEPYPEGYDPVPRPKPPVQEPDDPVQQPDPTDPQPTDPQPAPSSSQSTPNQPDQSQTTPTGKKPPQWLRVFWTVCLSLLAIILIFLLVLLAIRAQNVRKHKRRQAKARHTTHRPQGGS